MSDSAIQPDVQGVTAEPQDTPAAVATPPAEAAEKQAPPKSPREVALEEMEARRQQQLAAENGYKLEDVMSMEEEPPAPAPAPATAAPAPAADEQLAAQMAAGAQPEVPSKVKIKVDGVEAEVPFDEVIRQYQKNSSADRRLAEATRLLREAQETAAQRLLQEQQRQAAAAPAAPAAEPEPTPAADPNVEATGKEFLKALFEGDEDSALTKLKELTQAGRQVPQQAPAPTLDLEQISSAVAQHVQQKLVVESALARNRQDYPEMYADPDMEGLALSKIQRMREETGTDFFSALDTVSREFAHKFGWSAVQQGRPPADPVETTSPRAAKLERKAAIDNIAAVNTKITTAEPEPENASSIIAQMRAQRLGQRA
jgi:hypothetical protein